MIELKNQLKLTQQLILTPQLKLLLKVLQLNSLELEEYLLQEVQINPFLEIEYKDLAPKVNQEKDYSAKEVKLKDEIDLGTEEFLEKSLYLIETQEEPEEPIWEKTLKAEEKLSDYLLWQFRMKEVTPIEYEIAQYIVGNLDEKGYLTLSSADIAKELHLTEDKVEKVRSIIKFLDPVGVASYDFKECLLTQLLFLGYDKKSLPYVLVEKYFEQIPEGIEVLSQHLGIEPSKIEEALEVIKHLEPYPARNFYVETSTYIEPDLRFYKEDGEWKVEVLKEKTFTVRLNNFYREYLRLKKKNSQFLKSKQFLKEKLKEAENLLKALDSRYTSLYKVGTVILKHQKDFLEKGIKYLKPLTLKMVAEETELHESTISRIINHKYVQTPTGVYSLKFFFSSGYKASDGSTFSSKAIKDFLKQIIAQENPTKPLSDNEIAKVLKSKYGINIARRTVTKYREELQIPSVRERKKQKKG